MSKITLALQSALQVVERRFWLASWLLMATFGSLLTVIQRHPTIVDSDAFYHAKLAIWLSQGIIIKNFTWLPWTVLSQYFADHHFLYHLLLVPFVTLADPMVGVKVSIIVFGLAAILIYHRTLHQLGVKGAMWWTLVVFTTYPLIFRLSAVKALPLGLILFCLGLIWLFHRRPFFVFITQFIFGLTYSAWPLLLGTVIIHGAIIYKRESRAARRLVLAALGGAVAGLFFHPNWPEIIMFDWYQIIRFALIPGAAGAGAEWYPNTPEALLFNHAWIIALTLFIGAYVLVSGNYQRVFDNSRVKTLGLISIGLFILTVLMKRYSEYFTPIAGLELALLSQRIWAIEGPTLKLFWQTNKKLIFSSALIIIVAWGAQVNYNLRRVDGYMRNFLPLHYLEGAAAWTKNNLPAGTLVHNMSWADFPELLLFNDQVEYVWGLDSRFLSSVNPAIAKPFLKLIVQQPESYLEFLEKERTDTIIIVTLKYPKVIAALKNVAEVRYQDNEAVIFYYRAHQN